MCTCEGYDVVYGPECVTLEPHFCREFGDCGGGKSFRKALIEVAQYYHKYADNLVTAKDYDDYCSKTFLGY